MAHCIAVVSDLIFATRITATAQAVGAECNVVCDADALRDRLGKSLVQTVLVDMDGTGTWPDDAIRAVKSQCPSARVIAFYSHVQTELLQRAKAAGADEVLPRSTFVQRLPELLVNTETEE